MRFSEAAPTADGLTPNGACGTSGQPDAPGHAVCQMRLHDGGKGGQGEELLNGLLLSMRDTTATNVASQMTSDPKLACSLGAFEEPGELADEVRRIGLADRGQYRGD